jgi:hypothetical protein
MSQAVISSENAIEVERLDRTPLRWGTNVAKEVSRKRARLFHMPLRWVYRQFVSNGRGRKSNVSAGNI